MKKNLHLFILFIVSHLTIVLAQVSVVLPPTITTCNNPYSLAANPTGGVPPYTYIWSTGATTQVITVSQSGTYTVTVADASASSATATTNLTIAPSFSLSTSATTTCVGVSMTLSISGAGTAPYLIDWGGGGATSNISTTSAQHVFTNPGVYMIYVTDANGCQASISQVVQQTCGNVDLGPDQMVCIYNPPMPLIATGTFAAGSTYYWYDGNTGQSLNNPTNTYQPQPGMFGNICVIVTEPNGTVHTDCVMINPIIPPNIQILSNTNCLPIGGTVVLTADVTGGMAPPFMLLWNTNQNTSNITASTAGNYSCTVTDGFGCMNMAQYTLSNCSSTFSSITGVAYFDANSNSIFDAGDAPIQYHPISLNPSSGVVFTNSAGEYAFSVDTLVNYTVSASNIGNVAPAMTSYNVTFPNSGMVDAGNDFLFPPINDLLTYLSPYSNAVPGFPMYYHLLYENYGQFAANNVVVSMTYDPNLQFVFSTPPPTSTSGNTLTWAIGTLSANAVGAIDLHFLTPASTPLGTVITSSANIVPTTNDIFPSNNGSTYSKIVQGSWDPNAKSVSLATMTLPLAVSGKKLDYIVQFQNTGTAPAQKVVVMDTLDAKLDVLSFEMLAASHTFSLELIENHILKWTFDNIQLPDSNSNEPASHGFVHYQIAAKNSVQLGDVIHNTAAIYFDFNSPIFTQDATTTITNNIAINKAKTIGKLSLSPNPAQDKCLLSFVGIGEKSAEIHIYNANGKLVYGENIQNYANGFQKEISLKPFSSGIYYIQIQTENGMISQKLIKE